MAEFKIVSEESFTLQIGGDSYPGFTVESRWEGMVKYVNGRDWVIGVDVKAGRLIDMLFGVDEGEWRPILASPKIISAIKLAKEGK